MRRITRFAIVRDLSPAQHSAVITASVTYENEALRRRGCEPLLARHAAAKHRELIAAFCAPLPRAYDCRTGLVENRRRLAPVIGAARA